MKRTRSCAAAAAAADMISPVDALACQLAKINRRKSKRTPHDWSTDEGLFGGLCRSKKKKLLLGVRRGGRRVSERKKNMKKCERDYGEENNHGAGLSACLNYLSTPYVAIIFSYLFLRRRHASSRRWSRGFGLAPGILIVKGLSIIQKTITRDYEVKTTSEGV